MICATKLLYCFYRWYLFILIGIYCKIFHLKVSKYQFSPSIEKIKGKNCFEKKFSIFPSWEVEIDWLIDLTSEDYSALPGITITVLLKANSVHNTLFAWLIWIELINARRRDTLKVYHWSRFSVNKKKEFWQRLEWSTNKLHFQWSSHQNL